VNELDRHGPKSPDRDAGRPVRQDAACAQGDQLLRKRLALNERLAKAARSRSISPSLPDALEDEDKLEMLNAGLFEFVVVDDWKAKMWAQILPKIKVREDLVLRAEARLAGPCARTARSSPPRSPSSTTR
jgi:membrane-bound lytic murein transglycosylase MltF